MQLSGQAPLGSVPRHRMILNGGTRSRHSRDVNLGSTFFHCWDSDLPSTSGKLAGKGPPGAFPSGAKELCGKKLMLQDGLFRKSS